MSKRLSSSKVCPECNKEGVWFTGNMCHNCYRQKVWVKKKGVCPKCKRTIHLKSKGLCAGCYNTTYGLEYQKALNHLNRYGLNYEDYKKITQKCIICGFDKFVALHHLDQDKNNNSKENLVGLCPNHHQMLHTLKYRDQVFQLLKGAGFNPQEKKFRTDVKGGY